MVLFQDFREKELKDMKSLEDSPNCFAVSSFVSQVSYQFPLLRPIHTRFFLLRGISFKQCRKRVAWGKKFDLKKEIFYSIDYRGIESKGDRI